MKEMSITSEEGISTIGRFFHLLVILYIISKKPKYPKATIGPRYNSNQNMFTVIANSTGPSTANAIMNTPDNRSIVPCPFIY